LRLVVGATPEGDGPIARDTFAAAAMMARDPDVSPARTFRMSLAAPHLSRPALTAREAPDAWTLALRFEGRPRTLDGPGNFAIDAEGNLWVGNNYAYSRESRQPACGSEVLSRFTPTGRTYPGSP